MKIVLLGYMGSGKTTIGKLLAEKLKTKFLDLDTHIEAKEGMNISSLFKKKGEVYFRKKEAEYLREILSEEDFVLSIGGGTPCYANNMDAISELTEYGIYLKVGLPELVKRLSTEKSKRPLIASVPEVELHEFVGKHLFERSFYYNQANHTINCDEKNIAEIVIEIQETLS